MPVASKNNLIRTEGFLLCFFQCICNLAIHRHLSRTFSPVQVYENTEWSCLQYRWNRGVVYFHPVRGCKPSTGWNYSTALQIYFTLISHIFSRRPRKQVTCFVGLMPFPGLMSCAWFGMTLGYCRIHFHDDVVIDRACLFGDTALLHFSSM